MLLRTAVVVIEVIGVSAEVGPLLIRTRTSSSAQIDCKRSVLEVFQVSPPCCRASQGAVSATVAYIAERYYMKRHANINATCRNLSANET